MIIFTVHMHGPHAITKCYLPCADRARAYTWRGTWRIFLLMLLLLF